MPDHVSARALAVRPFVVMDVVARAKELESRGRDIVRMDVGDPDFATPDVITKAAEAAMEAGTPATLSRPACPTCATRCPPASLRSTASGRVATTSS